MRVRFGVAIGALLLCGTLGACDPIQTVREWRGLSDTDPGPDARNSLNLGAGSDVGYPNLATVPPPPSRSLSTAERTRLTQSLTEDRVQARQTDSQIRAGRPEMTSPVPSLPPAPAAPLPASGVPGQPEILAGRSAAPELPPPPPPVPLAPAPDLSPSGKLAMGLGGDGKKAEPDPTKGPRQTGQALDPLPPESGLVMPQLRGTPTPEPVRAPPRPSALLTLPVTPQPGVSSQPGPSQPASSQPAAPQQSAAAATARLQAPPSPLPELAPPETAMPAAPPPVPVLTIPSPPPQLAAANPGKGARKPAPTISESVADIAFVGDATELRPADEGAVARAVAAYKATPGIFRIVGHARTNAGATGIEGLESYRIALDRAQAVAAALSKAGVPPDKVQVQAVPDTAEAGRAEVLLER